MAFNRAFLPDMNGPLQTNQASVAWCRRTGEKLCSSTVYIVTEISARMMKETLTLLWLNAASGRPTPYTDWPAVLTKGPVILWSANDIWQIRDSCQTSWQTLHGSWSLTCLRENNTGSYVTYVGIFREQFLHAGLIKHRHNTVSLRVQTRITELLRVSADEVVKCRFSKDRGLLQMIMQHGWRWASRGLKRWRDPTWDVQGNLEEDPSHQTFQTDGSAGQLRLRLERVLFRPPSGRLRSDPQLLSHRKAALSDGRMRSAIRGRTGFLGSGCESGEDYNVMFTYSLNGNP